MTQRRPLGNAAIESVNQAAELINSAVIQDLEPIVKGQPMTHQEIVIRVLNAIVKQQKSLRWLEDIGAKTKP